MEYENLSLCREDGQPIWTIRQELSAPLLAGLIVGGNFCLYQIPEYNGEYFEITVNDLYRQFNVVPTFLQRIDTIDELNEYSTEAELIDSDISLDDTSKNSALQSIGDNSYALYVKNGKSDTDEELITYVDLYGFDSIEDMSEFIQGILTMSQAFNVNYHDFILHCPFNYQEESYAIEGYPLPILRLTNDKDDVYPLDDMGILFPFDADETYELLNRNNH